MVWWSNWKYLRFMSQSTDYAVTAVVSSLAVWPPNYSIFIKTYIHPFLSMGMWHQQLITNQKNVVVGKPKDKNPLCRSRHTWKDNIEMDRIKLYVQIASIWRGIGCNCLYKINLCFHNRRKISLLTTIRICSMWLWIAADIQVQFAAFNGGLVLCGEVFL
jgi:hypothetical protein